MQSAQSREDLSFTEPQCKNFRDLFKLKLALNIIHKILTVYFDDLHIGHSVGRSSGLWCWQRYTYRVLQTIQMKLILLCVWAELAVLGSTKTAIKFKYEI